MPLVSVIMVFHRDSPFLRPAIASVLAQTWTDFELLLVDNGTGLTPAQLGAAGADARVRWVRLPVNAGIAAGHNAGVAAACGEFIALHDYDDVSHPERLARQVAALQADPGLGLVSALARRIDADGRVTGEVFCVRDPAAHRAYAQFAAPVITPVAMGRREVFTSTPYRAEFPYAADLDFQSRVTERWRLAVLPEPLLDYRWYPGQTTQQKLAAIENSRCAISLLTARRRAGRAEGLAELVALAETLPPADYNRRVAVMSLSEGFAELAAYRARRSWVEERSLGSLAKALALASRAWRQAAPGQRARVARMFFTGPVRTLGLPPA